MGNVTFPPAKGMKRRSSVISTNQLPGPYTYVEKFGARGNGVTNDTAAIQAGINAMSAKGTAAGHQGFIYLTPGKTYKVSNLLAASNCVVWAYGARFVHDTTGNIFTNPITNLVSNFELRGGWIQGANGLSATQNALEFRGLTNSKIVDVRVTNIPTGSGIMVCDSTSVWIDRCTVSGCNYLAPAANAINLVADVNSDVNPLTDVWVTNCFVEGWGSEGIAIVTTTVATQTAPMRIRIENNTVVARNQTIPGAAAGAIEIENGGSSTVPMTDIQIIGNTIDGLIPAGYVIPTSLTGTTTNGSFQVTSVAGTGNAGATLHGMTVTGTNIPAGTVLVSGGGTATWTLSKAATGNGSTTLVSTGFYALAGVYVFNDNAVLDPAANKNIIIADNNIRNTQLGIQFAGSNVVVANNRIANAIQNANAGAGVSCVMNSGTQLSGITGDTDTTAHPATITNVAGANNTTAVNGMLVRGTGVTTGTTVVSGAGTSTWVLSQPATATNTGVALTVMPQQVDVNITGNVMHLQPDNTGISVQQIANSIIQNNLVRYEPGSMVDGNELNSGIQVIYGSNVRVQGNTVDTPPENGIYANHVNDLKVINNCVLNPGEASLGGSTTAGTSGLHCQIDVVGPATLIAGNSFDDTRVQLTGITGDTANVGHPTTITNVSGGANTSRVNGMYVTGAGIPALTRIVSGGGTATWTLSASTTATAAGVALTVTARAMTKGVLCGVSTNSLNNRATGFQTAASSGTSTVAGF